MSITWERKVQVRQHSYVQALYRDESLGVQKEVVRGTTLSGKKYEEVYFYADNDPKCYRTEGELIEAMEKP